MFERLGFAVTAAMLATAAAAPARADEPVLLDLEAAFVTPVTTPQIARFQPGGGASVGVIFAPFPFLLPTIRLRGAVLGDGAPPADVHLRDPGAGGLLSLTAGVRIRPQGLAQGDDVTRGTDAWVELSIGAALTGGLIRPTFELGLGYGFEAGEVDIGPALRLQHVMQTEEGLDASSAYLLTAGIDVVVLDRRNNLAPPEPEPEPEEPPPPDTDRDGIRDDRDVCPDDAEDADGHEDEDGCADLDDDADAILDAVDRCVGEPEDHDGWLDADGCTDADNDGDRIVDASDACPNEPERVNGVADDDGCPDAGLVEVVGDRIVIPETALFAPRQSRLRPAARPVVEALATLLSLHPEWDQVRIEGHLDAQGPESRAVALARRRAEAIVGALVRLGVPAATLVPEGLGSSAPRVEGTTEDARMANRRMEIVVTTRVATPEATP